MYLNAAREAGTAETSRRNAILDRMFVSEAFNRRWTTFLGDFFGAIRTNNVIGGADVNSYAAPSGDAVTAELAQAIAAGSVRSAHPQKRGQPSRCLRIVGARRQLDCVVLRDAALLTCAQVSDDGRRRAAPGIVPSVQHDVPRHRPAVYLVPHHAVFGERRDVRLQSAFTSPWFVERAVFGDDPDGAAY